MAREVGTEGKLGGQAEVPNVSGTWKDLTDNVNGLADGSTKHPLVTAAVNGDLGQKITVDVKGGLQIKDAINQMVEPGNVLCR